MYSQGHLVFLRDGTLMAQPFDTPTLTLRGEAVPIAEQIQVVAGNALFSASANGVLVYQVGQGTGRNQVTWFDRTGKVLSLLGEPNRYGDVQLSPDGTRAAVSMLDPAENTNDIWVFEIARGVGTRFTMNSGDVIFRVWSPDGTRIAFASRRAGKPGIYQRLVSGAGAEEHLSGASSVSLPASWSPDGRFLLLYNQPSVGGEVGLWVLPLHGDRKPYPFATSANMFLAPGSFSPDGRWVTYVSNETGRMEVYAAPFPGPGARTIVSSGGGRVLRWSRAGQEIVYVDFATQRFMSAPVTSREASLQVGPVRTLFDGRVDAGRTTYDITADGQRLLVSTTESREQTGATPR